MFFIYGVVELFTHLSIRLLLMVPWIGYWWIAVAYMSAAILRAYIVRAITGSFGA